MTRHHAGVGIVAVSAAAFAVMTMCSKKAFEDGVNVPTMMLGRFIVATTLFWLIVAVRRRAGRGGTRPSARLVVIGLASGAVVYAGQAALVFSALERIDAGLAILLFYVHPAIVLAVAWALGKERAGRERLIALGLASVGLALLLLTGDSRGVAASGILLALGAAAVYTLYLLLCDGAMRETDPFVLAGLVATGALVAYAVVGSGAGWIQLDLPPSAFGWTAGVGLATIGGIGGVLLALPLIGPSLVSLISTLEPLLTVLLAFVLFDERLGPAQLAGGALVLVAVVLLQLRHAPQPARSAQPTPR